MRDFIRQETVEAYVEVKTQAGAFVDPTTSITVTMTDSAGTAKVSAQAMTKSDTGKYVYYHTLPSDAAVGWWTVLIIITDGTTVTRVRGGFRVTT